MTGRVRLAALLALAVAAAVSGTAAAATNGPIAYVRSEVAAGSNPQIWLMGPTGTDQGPLTSTATANYSHPSLSAAGSLLAYAAQGPASPDIFTMAFSGANVADLAPDSAADSSPALSPDGTKVAYSVYDGTDYEIWVRPTAGGAGTQLTGNGAGVDDLNPAWSPDGTRIAFSSTRSGSYDIWVMNANGTTPTALTNTDTIPGIANFVREQYPAWSPDGTMIAYARMESNQINDLEAFDIWLMSSTGTVQHKATGSSSVKDTMPAWSPDGSKIAFASDRSSGGDDIWAMNADGTSPVDLTNTTSPIGEAQPAWGQPQPPSATWTGTSAVGDTSARVNGQVAASCLPGSWYVEWAQGSELPLAGGTKGPTHSTSACAPTPVGETLAGLYANTTYTARFVSTNSLGTAATNPQTFTTTDPKPVAAGQGSPSGGSGPGSGPGGVLLAAPFAAPPTATPGDDRLIGGPGHDVMRGGRGNDVLAGLGGDDLLDGGAGRDILDGGIGDDRLLGGSGADNLDGGAGKDGLEGGSGNDVLIGGRDDDRLNGDGGSDRMIAGAGNDLLNAVDGVRDRIDCGAGKKDVARVDKLDRIRGCERVIRLRPKKRR